MIDKVDLSIKNGDRADFVDAIRLSKISEGWYAMPSDYELYLNWLGEDGFIRVAARTAGK